MKQEAPYYFVPAPSYWPLVGAVALFLMGLGAAFWMNGDPIGMPTCLAGFGVLAFMMFGWFRDVIKESMAGLYSKRLDVSYRWSMAWFIFSEVMFFAAFFGALFYFRVLSVPELSDFQHKMLWPDFTGAWPLVTAPLQEPYQVIGAWGLPALNTLILLTSGATLTWAHWALLKNKRGQLNLGLGLTVALGVLFLYLQAAEYAHAIHEFNLMMSSGAYGASFYMLTGFHGFHVTVGTLMLFIIWLRCLKGHFDADNHFAFEGVAWYWHFVDVVWLLLFVVVYWI